MANYTVYDLVDPQKLKQEYPHVDVISPFYWDRVEVGHYVKIRREGETIWVQVREITDMTITGEIYYKLSINPYQKGDMITFKKCFQFDIFDPKILNLIPRIED